MKWNFVKTSKIPRMNAPVLIEGLPGIGNVGKVAVDFLVEELKAKKLYEIYSHAFPHSVFIKEDNLVDLPRIELYYKKRAGKKDLLFLSGDIQPIDEESSYEFCELIIDYLKKMKCKEIITLGGIGLQLVPKHPKVYCTGNNKKIVSEYAKFGANSKIFGVVGPIIGVSGLLLGVAKRKNISAVALLAETLGHPMYLGIKGAKETIKILDKKLNLKINIAQLEKEIKKLEKEITQAAKNLGEVRKAKRKKEDVSYIG